MARLQQAPATGRHLTTTSLTRSERDLAVLQDLGSLACFGGSFRNPANKRRRIVGLPEGLHATVARSGLLRRLLLKSLQQPEQVGPGTHGSHKLSAKARWVYHRIATGRDD